MHTHTRTRTHMHMHTRTRTHTHTRTRTRTHTHMPHARHAPRHALVASQVRSKMKAHGMFETRDALLHQSLQSAGEAGSRLVCRFGARAPIGPVAHTRPIRSQLPRPV